MRRHTLATALQALSVLGVFLLWTVTSFLCHYMGKAFLSNIMVSGEAHKLSDSALHAFALTTLQLGYCALFIQPMEASISRHVTIAKYSHALATLATNLSMSMMFASSTFAVKLLEPITSALLQYFMLGLTVSFRTFLSLPVIILGAITFTENPFSVTSTTYGVLAAFASNIILALRPTTMQLVNTVITIHTILALRNVTIKQMKKARHGKGSPTLTLNKERILPGIFFTLLTICGIIISENQGAGMPPGSTRCAVIGVLSAAFHVAYSYTSTGLVLEKISVVSHAVANISKRVLVVLLLYAFGTRVASPTNLLGFLICTVGLLMYAWDKSRDETAKRGPDMDFKSLGTWRPFLKKLLLYGLPLGCVSILLLRSYLMTDTHVTKESSFMEHMFENGAPHFLKSLESRHDKNCPCQQDKGYNIDPNALRDTLGSNGLDLPSDKELLPDMAKYSVVSNQSVQLFLSKRLVETPRQANFLSEELTKSSEVIQEAQRVHFNLIGDALKGFKYVMLFNIASFENKGDPCITMGEIYFLSRMKLEILYYCNRVTCTAENFELAATMAKKYSPKELVLLLHGGGNIVLYPTHDRIRFKILPMFAGYKFVMFPQSLSVDGAAQDHLKMSQNVYCCNPNLTLIMRDQMSYDLANKIFVGETKILMAPDMAFQIGPMPRFMSPVFDILWIKRGDKEHLEDYRGKLDFQGYKVHISDWMGWQTPKASNGLEQAFYVGTNGFFYLQRGRVLVTDRLHGHILATLMDMPHVNLDNQDFKISKYHNTWTKSLDNTLMTDDPEKALQLAIGLLKKYNHTLPPTVPYMTVSEDHMPSEFGTQGQTYP